MRYDRMPESVSQPGSTRVDRLTRRTSRGLALITLGLIAALLAGVGLVTAAVAISATDAAIDRTLEQAAAVRLATLEEQATRPEPTPSPDESFDAGESIEPERSDDSGGRGDNSGSGSGNSGSGSDNSGRGSDDDDRPTAGPSPQPTPAPSPTPSPTPAFGLPAVDDAALESADTFFLVVSPTGDVISNPQRVALVGLPSRAAAAAAIASGEDWRTVDAGGQRMRLLTQRVLDENGAVAGLLQSGFVLDLRDQQVNQMLATIALASLAGLLGAAVVTVLVTGRALRPIRSAFAAERRFVASASHELRTPVAVVRASAEILQREDLVKPGGEKLVEDIISESDRLARLVSDLLALASAEAGAITVERRPLEMRAFVADVARRAEAMATERGVGIEVEQIGGESAADRELMVSADPDRMAQLLLIFVDNAVDHSPQGGVVRLQVQPITSHGRAQVSVAVADQGPGVPQHERSRIFEPFARLTGRRRETGNTGLGLAIAQLLAARHDAVLHVGDAEGGGAVFSVWLPRRLLSELDPASA